MHEVSDRPVYFKSAVEMAQVFGEIPEALSRTVELLRAATSKWSASQSVPGVQSSGRAYFRELF